MRIKFKFNISSINQAEFVRIIAPMTFKSIYKLIKQSLVGDESLDFTSIPLNKAVFILAVPMILELSLESVFAIVDIYFVSRLGESAIAAVGLTESVMTLVYSLAIGLSTAATAIVARRIGEKDPEAASKTAGQTIFLTAVVILSISIVGSFYASDVLVLMGADQQVVEEGSIFTTIMFAGSFSVLFLFLINGIFRGIGNASMAMKSLWIASIINIILDPIFIYLFGLKGAAIATVIGRSIGVAYQVYFLFKSSQVLKLTLKSFIPEWIQIKHIVGIAWPATFQFLLASGSWIVLARFVADSGGMEALAGYQVALRNVIFFILPAWGLSNAAATLVGQNLGAKKVDRAEKAVYITAKFNAIFMFFISILFIFFPDPIILFFSNEPTVLEYGTQSLQIIGYGYVFYGVGMVMIQALNGAGDTKTPTLINFIGFWLFQVPFAYYLGFHTDLGVIGIFMAIPASESFMAILAFFVFKRGKWKSVEV